MNEVWIVQSTSWGIHGVYDSREKALEAKEEADLDLGMSGSLYTSYITKYMVK